MICVVYIKCMSYLNVVDELLVIVDKKLVENSVYDYFWGCGCDCRGNNKYGEVLMNIRDKL